MKVMIIGSFKSNALEGCYLKYLTTEFEAVDTFPALDYFQEYYYKNGINKIRFRLGLSNIYREINDRLLDFVHEKQPDIVWVFRGMEIYPQTLQKLRSDGIKLANFNPDHPFIYNRGTGNKNVENSVKEYDLHFCYNENLKEQLSSQYGIPSVHLPFGYDLSEDLLERIKIDQELKKVAFVGSFDQRRSSLVVKLVEAGVSIDVYGNGWKRSGPKMKGLSLFDAVYDEDFWRTLRKYRLQLNIYKEHNRRSHNQRTFEVPAVGGILLEPYGKEVENYFVPGKELFTYDSEEEMITVVNKVLSMTPEVASQMRAAARLRSVESSYSYENRAKIVVRELKKLVVNP